MSGYGFPTNIDSTDHAGLDKDDHERFHDGIHDIINRFDKDAEPQDGYGWLYDSDAGLYLPKSLDAIYSKIGHTHGSPGSKADSGIVFVDARNGNDSNDGLDLHSPVKTIHEAVSREPGLVLIASGDYDFKDLGTLTMPQANPPALVGIRPWTQGGPALSGGDRGVRIHNTGTPLQFYIDYPQPTQNGRSGHIENIEFDMDGITDTTTSAAIHWRNMSYSRVIRCRGFATRGRKFAALLYAEGSSSGPYRGDVSWNRLEECMAKACCLLFMDGTSSTQGQPWFNRWVIQRNVCLWYSSAVNHRQRPYIHTKSGAGGGGHWIAWNSIEDVSINDGMVSGAAIQVESRNTYVIGNSAENLSDPSRALIRVESTGCIVIQFLGDFPRQGLIFDHGEQIPQATIPEIGFSTFSPVISSYANIYFVSPKY